ncbi:hypothetical protein GCM10023340_34640 [Nocardioides marinquilinus]|uniref:Fibronectin type III domain-containing protein n=1 Tax=Nocardioides marinquilinus TaxID=1210400 RepID=A0ABP9PZ23_9ACTN
MLASGVAAGLLALLGAVPGTSAAFTDETAATGGALGAHTVVSQAQPTCTDVLTVARIQWVKTDVRYDYAYAVRHTATGVVVATGTAGTATPAGGMVTLDVAPGLLSGGQQYDVEVRARLALRPTWVAATATVTPVRHAGVLVVGLAVRCGHV